MNFVWRWWGGGVREEGEEFYLCMQIDHFIFSIISKINSKNFLEFKITEKLIKDKNLYRNKDIRLIPCFIIKLRNDEVKHLIFHRKIHVEKFDERDELMGF